MTGFVIGYKFYKDDNGIPTEKTEPKWIAFWVISWIILPITFIIMAFLDDKKD